MQPDLQQRVSMKKRSRNSARQQEKRRSLNILITAGPTREYLDSVRFISNPSSGKMGYAIAAAAARRGHRVTLVSGPVAMKPPPGCRTIHVETGDEMFHAAREAFRVADAAIFCAAVCDYRPQQRANRKLPKAMDGLTVKLVPTIDIAANLGRIKGRRVTIAFALEDHDGRRKAKAKMIAKRADAIVLNGPGNIGSNTAAADFLTSNGGWKRWPSATKTTVAKEIMIELEQLAGH